MSEFHVEVVRIGEIENHPNADLLEITRVHGGYPCIVKKGTFKQGDLGIYIPIDTVLPDVPAFEFLGKDRKRLKAKRLRGVFSMGLIIPAEEGMVEGQDVTEHLGVTRWEESEPATMKGENEKAPIGWYFTHYTDIEGLRRYQDVLIPGEEVVLSEKIHGCVNGMTSIWMADGSRKRVTDVNVGDEVLGVDDDGIVTAASVLATYRNGHTNDWLRIEVSSRNAGRGSYKRVVTVTPEHRFWNPDSSKYIFASDLVVGDSVSLMRTDQELTPIQKSVLIGKMLGDGSLHVHANGVSAAVNFGHAEADEGYVHWTIRALGSLATRSIQTYISGYGTTMKRTGSSFRSEIAELFADWKSTTGKKRIPEWVGDCLDPISIAFWFMDDGSLSHHEDQEDRAAIATNSFTEEDCAVLIRGLARFNIVAEVFEAHGNRLRFNAESAERLFLLIAPYIPPCMQRKLPERYRGYLGWLPPDREWKPSLVTNKITSITKVIPSLKQRYDLETTTNNYFASGILVHNCNARFIHDGERLWVGSRTCIKAKDENNLWWKVALALDLETRLASVPFHIFFGEVFGQVQDLKYGHTGKNTASLRIFDVFDVKEGNYLDHDVAVEMANSIGLDWVPILYRGPWSKELFSMAEGSSVLGDHVREGFVVKPIEERYAHRVGRVILKLHGEGYLTRKDK